MKKIHILRLALLAGLLTSAGMLSFAFAKPACTGMCTGTVMPDAGQNITIGTTELSNGPNGQSVSIGSPGPINVDPGYRELPMTEGNPDVQNNPQGVRLINGSDQGIAVGPHGVELINGGQTLRIGSTGL